MKRRTVTLRLETGEILHQGPEPWDRAPRGGRGDRCFLEPWCARTRFHDGICADVGVVGDADRLAPEDVIFGREVLGLDEPSYTADPMEDIRQAIHYGGKG